MKVLRITSLLLLAVGTIIACSRDPKTDTGTPSPSNPTEASHTILELIDEYSGKEVTDAGVAVAGTVISSDEDGNVKNEIFLQDDSGALLVSILGDNLHQTYPRGAELLINCTGLRVDGATRSLIMANGQPLTLDGSGNRISVVSSENDITEYGYPAQLSDEDLNNAYYTYGYQFAEVAVGENFVMNNQTTVRTMTNIVGDEIKVVFEPGSSFDGEIIPAKQGPVKGILVKVNSEYTLRPYRLSDLEFTFERNPPFEKQTFTYNGNTLPYQVMFPRAYDPNGSYPLVVFLHGAGERGTNNTSQMAYGPNTFGSYEARSDYPAIVIFPQCPSDVMWSRRAKYDQNGQLIFQFPVEQDPNYAMNMVIELVRDFVANEAVDDKRIYVSGLSMGGIGTFEFCYYAPDLPAAAISIAGGHDSSFVSGYATNIDFRLYHGGKDGVVPPRYSQEMHTALQQGGFSSEYFEAPNRGHEWNYVLNDPDYIQWMFNQSR